MNRELNNEERGETLVALTNRIDDLKQRLALFSNADGYQDRAERVALNIRTVELAYWKLGGFIPDYQPAVYRPVARSAS